MIRTGEVTPPKWVTLTIWGSPPPCKQALSTPVYRPLKFARFQSRIQSLLGTALPRWPKSLKTLGTKLGVRGIATCTHGSQVRTQIGFQRSDDINCRTESWMIYLYSRLDDVKRERVVFSTTSLRSRRAQLRQCLVLLSVKNNMTKRGKIQSSVNKSHYKLDF